MADPSLRICHHGDDPTICDICSPLLDALMRAEQAEAEAQRLRTALLPDVVLRIAFDREAGSWVAEAVSEELAQLVDDLEQRNRALTVERDRLREVVEAAAAKPGGCTPGEERVALRALARQALKSVGRNRE